MEKFLRISIVSALVVFLFGAAAVTQGQAQVLRTVLTRMENHYRDLKTLTAKVKMDKFNSQLGEHDVSEGSTIYVPQKGRDALVRVEWEKPVEELLSVVNKEYVIYRPRLKQAIKGKVNKAQGNAKASSALAFMNMSKSQLQANYTINYLGVENVGDGTPTWHLQLLPKVATSYKSAELWVNKDGLPIQAKVIENNNDTTTVFLYGVSENVTVDASKIPISVPRGTKIIEG